MTNTKLTKTERLREKRRQASEKAKYRLLAASGDIEALIAAVDSLVEQGLATEAAPMVEYLLRQFIDWRYLVQSGKNPKGAALEMKIGRLRCDGVLLASDRPIFRPLQQGNHIKRATGAIKLCRRLWNELPQAEFMGAAR